jgi:hypothetical protein
VVDENSRSRHTTLSAVVPILSPAHNDWQGEESATRRAQEKELKEMERKRKRMETLEAGLSTIARGTIDTL